MSGGEAKREGERERIGAVSAETDTGLKLTNRKIMT